MKKIYLVFSILVMAFSYNAIAQNITTSVKFAKGNFIPSPENNIQNIQKEKFASALFNNQYFVLLQFAKLPNAEEKNALKKVGVFLENYMPNNSFYAVVNSKVDFKSLQAFNVSSVNIVTGFYKTDNAIDNFLPANDKLNHQLFAIQFYKSISKETVTTFLKNIGATIASSKFINDDIIFIEANKSIVTTIAALPFVISISKESREPRTLNYEDIGAHAITAAQTIAGRNLQGKNVTIGSGDNADISSHIDFANRAIVRVAVPPSNHGTHTAGTATGAGIKNPLHKGVAPKTMFVNNYFTDIITETPIYVNDYNLIATNNSYYVSEIGCVGSNAYSSSSNFIDNQMYNYKDVLHVFAAGNDGLYNCSGYPTGFATIKSGGQTAKNVLTVGNINVSNHTINIGSSKGPVNDGRIKPEIVAHGTFVTSTFPNNNYATISGTSMSAPVVTGAAGLLVERYRQLNSGSNPKAALVKALLCNTAEDLGNAGPDFTFGFGMLNVRRAIETIETNRYFVSNTNASFPITIPAGARRLKVLLYWADAPAIIGAASTLVNDIDLTVTGAAGLHLPLILNSSIAGVNNIAAEGADHINNIEQVVIDNPAAGNYSLNANLFNIPVGPQEYIITYQVDMNGVTVEYPYGGETLVPGETETIIWSANGDEASTYSIDYSDNNGGSWTNIASTVSSTARSLNWTVPTTATNNGLIRVTKNTSGNTDVSDYKFTVLGVPTLSNSVPCEGYVDLNWTTVVGATSYDILQLKADSMSVIANVVGTNFLVQGLNNTSKYWFAVRANNGSIAGRRSIAQDVIPATGTCTLSNFDNNFKAVSIDAPVSGRKFTSSSLTSSEQIKVTIKNLDDVASVGSYNLYYQINAGAAILETSSIAIPALGFTQFTFATTANFSLAGIYNIKAWVKKVGDAQLLDDTTFVTIKQLENAVLTLPILDGFETTSNADYLKNTIGIDGDDRVDFKTNSTRGRARTFVNTGFAASGTKAITLDQVPVGALVTDSLLMTFNASSYNTGNQLRLDFDYKNHGQANNPDNKVWIRGSDTNPWILAYDLAANQAALGLWKKGIININNVLDTVVPTQTITSSFQIKFGQQGNTSANLAIAQQDIDDGYTFDDVKFSEALNDLELSQVLAPASGCGAVGSQVVQVKIKNYGTTTATSVPVSYRVNGGTIINDFIPSLAAGAFTNFNFATPISFAINTDYNIDVWVNATGDTYRRNDSLLQYNIHTSPVVTSFPYLEGFETNDGNFYAKGSNSTWQWGTPTKTIINKAANGTKVWVTNLTTNYNNLEQSYLYSPCFNLSTLTAPVLSFSHIYKTELDYDYNWVEYSIDGGKTWTKLGVQSLGTNWYNDVKNLWNISNAKWHVASYDIPTNATSVKFRFAFTADEGVTDEGVGIDDIHIFDKNAIYIGANTTAVPLAISGTNWIDLKSATGEKIASINPQGNNLGTTNAAVYFNTAAVRFTAPPNNQYYLDRNIVITPTTAPASPVLVRYYFTDAEINALINATGCGICSKISTAYDAGITKYSGTAAEENGSFTDNISGTLQFILPANTLIIPYDKGYYAEFSVSSFSEFWINSGGINANQPLPINIIDFTATKQGKQVKLAWQTSNEKDNTKFVIERSVNGQRYEAIGNMNSNNVAGINNYMFTDALPNIPINFYRIKLVDDNGKVAYTDVRKINFDKNGLEIVMYPNPVSEGIVKIISSENCNKAILFDAVGKAISTYILQGKNNKINVQGLAKGMYQLQVFTSTGNVVQKVIIE
jgi:hypothetical protein